MIEFAVPALGGIAAIAAPVLIHIAHRRRFSPMSWGAMRFLQELLARKRRRMSIDNLLLLAVRMLAIACLALALTRPQLSFRAAGLGDLISRQGRTSAIIMIDDSLSTAAPRGAPAFAAMQKLGHAYLETLKTGDEVSIVQLSRLGDPVADPIYDLTAAGEAIDKLSPTAVGSDMPALIDAALDRVGRHLNPDIELVLLSDGRAEGFGVDAKERWERLRARLRGPDNAVAGTRARPHVILLSPRSDQGERGNLAVSALRIDRTLLPPGKPVAVRATISYDGARPIAGALVRLLVNGRDVAEQSLDLAPGEIRELVFIHAFAEPGSYLLEAVVEGARDALAEDDRRALAVEVETRLPVLLIEGKAGRSLDGSLGMLAAALDPLASPGGTSDGRASTDLFAIERAGVSGLTEQALSAARVVVLGDVPALDAGSVSALERFVVGGGGILVVAGPATDPELANRFWARSGDGFLPARLGPARLADKPLHPSTAAIGHPALEAFTSGASDAWKEISVSRWFPLESPPADCERLLALDGGEPLLVDRARGRGRVALLATGLDGAWSDLPYRSAFVPMSRSLIAWLGGNILPPRNLLAGERLSWFPAHASATNAPGIPTPMALAATAEGPDGKPVALAPSAWEGHPALVSGILVQPGAYAVREAGGKHTTWFEVGISPGESRLAPLSPADLQECLHDVQRHAVSEPKQVTELFTSAGNRTYDLWRVLVIASASLLLVETLLTRGLVGRERAAA